MSTLEAPQPRDLNPMAPEAMADYLRARLESRLVDAKIAYGQLTATVAADALPDAARLCKQDPNLDFDFFDFMAGVDERDEGFAVITHLYSLRHGHHINLRAIADGGRETPVLPTITEVYRGANWHEREAYDMFGIEFAGHPGLRPRILTTENFEGWPLRKEFLLTTREAKPWPGAKEPEDRKHDEGTDAPAESGEAAPVATEDRAAAAKAKAERAKAKAAEMRAKKARERAAAEQQPEGGDETERAAAEQQPGGGESLEDAMTTEQAQTPEGAAEIADTAVAKDAAAGAVGGDTAAGAPGDAPGADEPVDDAEAEAALGEGAAHMPSGAPGVEAEGRHEGADEQSGDKPAAETPGLDAEPEPAPPARDSQETPAPDADEPGDGDEDEERSP